MVSKLNPKQLQFCREYVLDWNATKAAERAGYSKRTAYSQGGRLLKHVEVQAEIKRQTHNTEVLAGVSKLKAVKELAKFAFNRLDQLHDTWIDRKEFDKLSDDVKSCIQEIDVKVVKRDLGTDGTPDLVDVEHVKIKLVDKRGALQDLAKLLGWNSPERTDLTSLGERLPGLSLTGKQVDNLIDKL